jgi:hypothetical protein
MARKRKQDDPLVGSMHSQNAIVANVANVYQGGAWIPNERDVAVEIVKELENRRALYDDYELEVPRWIVQSVLEMRDFFHQRLLTTRHEGALDKHLRALRAACKKFLSAVGENPERIIIKSSFEGGPNSWAFFTALGELRAAVGLTLSLLMAAYGLNCEPQLARILPADPAE